MRRARHAPIPWSLLATYVGALLGYAVYTRAFLAEVTATTGVDFLYWDVVTVVLGSRYVVAYAVLPAATWCLVRQLQHHARPDDLIRYATRTDWAFGQGRRALPWIGALVGGLVAVALLSGLGRPAGLLRGPLALDPDVVAQMPELGALLPSPVLDVLLHAVALALTLVALTVVAARCATGLRRPGTLVAVPVALLAWSIVSAQFEGWLVTALGPLTYALPARAATFLPLGPAGGVVLLVAAGALSYRTLRAIELRERRPDGPSWVIACMLAGCALVLGLALMAPGSDPTGFALHLLQGSARDGLAPLHVLVGVVIALLPAMVAHASLVDALSGSRYAEMTRVATPGRWYLRRVRPAAALCAGYGAVVACWALVVTAASTRAWPAPATVGVIGLWGLALICQALVLTVLLAAATAVFRRVEVGGYACVAIVALSLPLGAVSGWSPAGQASLARLTEVAASGAVRVDPMPLVTLAVWTAVLLAVSVVLFNRTRGEIV